MLSLSDKLIESKMKIEDYVVIREDSKNIKSLEQYNENIQNINNKLKEMNLIIEALEKIVGNDLNLEAQMKLKELLNRFSSKLKNEYVDRFNSSYLQYISPIHEYLGTMKNEYSNSWQKYYEQNYNSSVNLLNMLNTILEDYEIIKIRNDISKFSKKWPINIKDLEELGINSEKAYKKISDLNLNVNIENFLEKLINNQIRLSDIDDEVYKWLKINNLDNKIKLKL